MAAAVTKRPQQNTLTRATRFRHVTLAVNSRGIGIEMRYRSVLTFMARKVQTMAGDTAGWQYPGWVSVLQPSLTLFALHNIKKRGFCF